MSDFGFCNGDLPVIRCGKFWHDNKGFLVPRDAVTPVQVVAPGQVAIRTKVAALAAKLLAQHGHYVADDLRAALAATEPAPDTEQGERKLSMVHLHGPDRERGLDCPEKRDANGKLRGHCVAPELWNTPAASGGGTEADGGEGEDPGSVQGRCPSCGGSSLFLGAGGYVTCSRSDCGEPDAATTLLEHTPAAEPERVTLPDTVSRSELVHALEDLINDGHVDSEVTAFAANLANKLDPDSRVIMDDLAQPPKADDGFTAETYRQGYAQGVRDADQYAKYGIRKPPKADPAETDAPEHFNDEACACGCRDETDAPHGPTLAAVVRAMRLAAKHTAVSATGLLGLEAMFIEDAIEREAGGGGHE